jgi:dolichol kinase
LVGLSMIGACSLPTDLGRALLGKNESRVGTVSGVVVAVIIFTGFTVHFWGSLWILLGLLTGLRAHLGELGALNKRDYASTG